MIDTLAFFRNQIGVTERDLYSVKYTGDVDFDGINLKDVNLSDRSSLLGDTKRLFHTKEKRKKSESPANLHLFYTNSIMLRGLHIVRDGVFFCKRYLLRTPSLLLFQTQPLR